MTLLKRLERELALDWEKLQLQRASEAKLIALRAYHLKFALYRKTRAWREQLSSGPVGLL